MSATNPVPVHAARRAALGAVGGALWALSPAAWLTADIRTVEPGTAFFAAVLATYGAVLVAGPALIVVGHTAIRTALGPAAGRTGTLGAVLGGVGLSAYAVGNAVELVSLAAGGGTSVVGYVVSYLGFLVGFVGSLLVGIAVLRRRGDAPFRIAGWLLALALPLAIGLGALMATVLPGNEAGFALAVSLPTGLAWVLLGRSIARSAGAPRTSLAPSAAAR